MLSDIMIESYYAALTTIFTPILFFPKPIAELILAIIVIFIITLFYKYMINQDEVRKLKDEQKTLQQKMKEVQNNPEETKRLTTEIFKLSNRQMQMSFKPMIPTLIFAAAILPWMSKTFGSRIVMLPFTLPYFGNDFGWLMWYLIISFPLSILFRKMMGVEL